jgi:ABC-type sugar transport system substrate-binding protein
MWQVAQAAVAADIGWVVLNRKVDYLARLRAASSVPVFAVNSDHEDIGRIQGQQFNALLPAGGCVLYLEGPSTSEVSRIRTQGMLASKRSDISVKTLRGDWTEGSAYHAVKSWLRLPTSRELHIAAVGCQNDAMAIGAHRALQEFSDPRERGRLLHLPLTGCDGVPSKGRAYVERGNLAATVVAPPLTGPALEMIADAFRNHRVPPEETMLSPSSFPALEKLR